MALCSPSSIYNPGIQLVLALEIHSNDLFNYYSVIFYYYYLVVITLSPVANIAAQSCVSFLIIFILTVANH